MIATLQARELTRRARMAGSVLTRSPLPIQACLLLTARDGRLSLRGSSYECDLQVTGDAQVERDGEAAIPYKEFASLLARLPNVPVTLTAAENRLTAEAFTESFTLLGLPPEEFPDTPEAEEERSLTAPAPALLRAMTDAFLAASDDPSRPVLTGLHLGEDAEKVSLCGASMPCLMVTALEIPSPEGLDAVLTPEFVKGCKAALAGVEGEATVSVSDRGARLTVGEVTLAGRLIDGKFPNFSKVIPKEFTRKAIVDAHELRTAVRRVAPVATGEHRIAFRFTAREVEVRAENASGSASSKVECTLEGEGLDLYLDGKLLHEALGALGDGTTVELTHDLAPVVFRDGRLTYIQMPLRKP